MFSLPPTAIRILTAIGVFLFLLGVGLIYAFSNPHPQGHFDYQFRIATALLHGKLGLDEFVSWLTELVPFEGRYYSVFPLGSVLCQIPTALIQQWRGTDENPIRHILAIIVAQIALFALALSARYKDSKLRRGMLITWLLFGTWIWCNFAMGNAWQLALALAFLGQFGALYFTLGNRVPLLAGFYFAIAYGNRTEIVLTAPLFLYLFLRKDPYLGLEGTDLKENLLFRLRREWKSLVLFCVFPFLLGVSTLWYNYARFHSPMDFGYARIPGVLNEYWYRHGIFSLQAIPMNIHEMLWHSSWEPLNGWPFIKPNSLGGSIISSTPFLIFLVAQGGRDRALNRVCWIAICLLTLLLWLHGNSGGRQFSYRYATVLLPWIWVLFLDRRGGKVSWREWLLLGLSVFLNGWATYTYYWTRLLGEQGSW